MIKEIEAKTILSKNKNPFKWFGITYNTNFYRGCMHKCIYCDSRSECYKIDNFDDIEVKINAPFLMEKELSHKKLKATVGTGAMSDPYIPLEMKYKITRKCLEIIDKYQFPVTIITKSHLVLDDIDILKSINKNTQATVIFTITTTSDALASIIEPNAPLPSKRLEAMKLLSEKGIYTGVLMMPLLPFINDTKENVVDIVEKVYQNKGKFIIPCFGVTLRDRQRDYFYEKLDENFKGLKEKYINTYHNYYMATSKNYSKLNQVFKEKCKEYNIIFEMGKVLSWEKRSKNAEFNLFGDL